MTTNEYPTADGRYYIKSYGNGWAYEVTHQESGASFWVQDDDAQQLRDDTNDFENTDVLGDYMEAHDA